jgi:membrane protein
MLVQVARLVRDATYAFIEDEALTRGAAIAFYTVTSIGPVLFIVVAIGGLAFGEEAARGAVAAQLTGLVGKESADLVQAALQGASRTPQSILASVAGAVTLLVTASGVFAEMQGALNALWRAPPRATTVSRLVRARIVSLGLVAALGFLLLVSLVVSAVLTGLGDWINARLPWGTLVLGAANLLVSYGLVTLLFAAIYKVLPDVRLAWRDVVVGAVLTALLFNAGKFLIALYLARSAAASGYGAAGAVILLLLWIYWSAQIFLFGAELTKVYAAWRGSRAGRQALA